MEIAINELIEEINRCERHLAIYQHIRYSEVYKRMEFKVSSLKKAVAYLNEYKLKHSEL